jgi:hypothetical protein
MKKIILAALLCVSTFATVDNTGWSGRLLENKDFNEQVRMQVFKSYNKKCGSSQKDIDLPPVILISAKESTVGYLGAELPEFTITLRTFSAVVMDYVEQNFDIKVEFDKLKNKFKIDFSEDFEIECID